MIAPNQQPPSIHHQIGFTGLRVSAASLFNHTAKHRFGWPICTMIEAAYVRIPIADPGQPTHLAFGAHPWPRLDFALHV